MFISSLLFGISASLDALLVGISYGLRQIRIKFWQNLIISLITLLGTCLSVGLGHKLVTLLPKAIQGCAGSLILILLGFYYIIKWAIASIQNCRQKSPPEAAPPSEITSASTRDTNYSEDTSSAKDTNYTEDTPSAKEASPSKEISSQLKLVEVLALSLTLSLNNLSAGLSASLAGLTLLPTAVSTLICSVLFLFSGNRLGQNPVLQMAGHIADPLSGVLLIGLGVVQFFL